MSEANREKRLRKEMKDLQKTELETITAGPIDEKNIYKWNAVIIGPEDTPYEGGTFQLLITFPLEYPFRPPKVEFKTRIFHPNINRSGQICLDILKGEWSPALTIIKVLLSVCSLLTDPNADDPLDSEAARVYKNNRDEYNRKVKEMVEQYAK